MLYKIVQCLKVTSKKTGSEKGLEKIITLHEYKIFFPSEKQTIINRKQNKGNLEIVVPEHFLVS